VKFFDRSIERPLPVYLLGMLVAFFGLWSLTELPVTRAPSIRMPFSMVVVPYVGATPDEVESEVTLDLEEELVQVDDMRHIRSVSSEGSAVVFVEFEDRTDLDEAQRQVRTAVDRAEAEFEDDVEVPLVQEMSTDDQPIISFVISGPIGPARLRQLAEDLSPSLEAVEGVNEIEIFGGFEPEVRVFADPAVLAEYGLTLTELSDRLRQQARAVPAGQLRGSTGDRLVRATGEFGTLDEIRSIVVINEPGGAVTLGDLATVAVHHKRRESYSSLDGDPSVTLIATRKPDVNTMDTVEQLKKIAFRYAESFPTGVRLTTTQDASIEIGMMLEQLGTSALLGLILLMAVLMVAFGWRQALLVASVLPFSLLVTFLGLFVFDMSISNMSIFSLILVLGLVVDGALIVAEAIHAEVEDGFAPMQAAARGIHRVGLAVLAADITTVAAFFPMVLMIGVMGQFMSVMPKVVVFAITGSVFVDHFLIPAVAARMKHMDARHRGSAASAGSAPMRSESMGSESRDRSYFARKVRPLYQRWLEVTLRHPVQLLSACGLSFVLAIVLIGSGVIKSIFMPTTDRGRVIVRYASPLGTPLEETNRIGGLLANELEGMSEVERFVLTAGTGGGSNPFGMGSQRSGPERGALNIELVPADERIRTQSDVAEELRQRFENYAGVTIEVQELSEGGNIGEALSLRVRGRRFDEVQNFAVQVEQMVRGIEGVRDVNVDYERSNPELRVEVDRGLASSEFSLTPQQVSQALRVATVGVEVGRMWVGDERVDLRLSAPEDYAEELDRIRELPLRAANGTMIPLGALATVGFDFSPKALSRYDTERSITISAGAKQGYDTVALTSAATAGLAELSRPDGVDVAFGGQSEERQRSLGSLIDALGWGLLLIFIVIAIQFNSIIQPFIVLACIPLSIVGVTLGLLLTGTDFSFSVFIGIVSLTGIVVNDGIVMIDGINQYRDAGMPVRRAVREASLRRLRPVLLTTITTVAGILPLTLNLTAGGEFWVPLGIAIISGLLLASFLTLFVVPVIYWQIEGRLRLVWNLRARRRRSRTPPLEPAPFGAAAAGMQLREEL